MIDEPLPSWRAGATRSAILGFIEAADELAPTQRVAVFDNDGTLWCEKPNYPQLDFLAGELVRAVAAHPELAQRPEYQAVLTQDRQAMAEMGLPRIAFALLELCEGITPEEFDARVARFFARARHPDTGLPYPAMRYQPMLELVDALRTHEFRVFVVSGGGTEFVRAVSESFYGVRPEGVVGTQVAYDLTRVDGRPRLVRTNEMIGDPNEGETKITSIQRILGRRPILAAGNSAGDTEMLEYAMAVDGPSLALLVDHDDADREYAYESVAGTFESSEPITDTAARLGWTTVSMRSDWSRIFVGP
ncbi:MAG: HAD family hydrolase [Microthrixaceae bacterium]